MPKFKLLFNSAFSKQLCFLMPRFLALFPPFKLFLTFKETIKLTKKIIDFPEWPVLILISIQHVCTALWSCHMENQTSRVQEWCKSFMVRKWSLWERRRRRRKRRREEGEEGKGGEVKEEKTLYVSGLKHGLILYPRSSCSKGFCFPSTMTSPPMKITGCIWIMYVEEGMGNREL